MKTKIRVIFTKSFWAKLFVLFFNFIVIFLNAQNNYYKTDYSSPPVIVFTQGSNPTSVFNSITDTAYTFPTRTFFWDVQESDSLRTIVKIYYAIDDTNTWNELPGEKRSVTLSDLPAGQRQFFAKAENDLGFQSNVISFPDTNDPYCPNIWIVKDPIGDVLLVNDFAQDQYLFTVQSIYENMLVNIVGVNGYSVWKIGHAEDPMINPQNSLPYSTIDILANLNYFKKVIWFAHFGPVNLYSSKIDTSLTQYIADGGMVFISYGGDARDSTLLTFSGIDSVFLLNPGGRLLPGICILSSFTNMPGDSLLDLEIGMFIGNRVNALIPVPSADIIYRMEPDSTAGVSVPYSGSPGVGIRNKYGLGKSIYFSLPFHYCDGKGNIEEVLQYILEEDFANIEPNLGSIPSEYKLYQNYPNPFNPTTTISYSIPKSYIVTLKIYDILGREIKILVNNYQRANTYSVKFNATELSSGIYYYKLQLGNKFSETKKMLIMK